MKNESNHFIDNRKDLNTFLHDPHIPAEFKVIVNDFFLIDNIDIELYNNNYKAYKNHQSGSSYSILQWMGKIDETRKINWSPTPTFETHYLDYKFSLNKPRGIHEWFVFAYPDVTKWFASGWLISKEGELFLANYNEIDLFDDKGTTLFFYRLMINEFKKDNKLECAIYSVNATEKSYGIGNFLFAILIFLAIFAILGFVKWSTVGSFAKFIGYFLIACAILLIGLFLWAKSKKT